ncbi:bifunctional diaminohydroxyphosphoribosylaminopyrimidine deaminase/5-amino-6-(5-phosphoribosylamino)uracil reductase RibD [soil metagenome]
MQVEPAMRRALALGASVLGATSPNPPVGAVVMDQKGRVVGEGATAPAGGPHAELTALRRAGPRARGGTAVSTLEPCAHTGRTGPCTEALIAAGITRVVYAVTEPSGQAAGGAAVLRAAGIDVQAGRYAEEAAVGALRGWLFAVTSGRPFVTWKYAATLDGRVAAADGSSRWITGPEARADVHRLRAESDAILVGSGTVLVDDPHLTTRLAGGRLADRQPLRVVRDRSHRIPAAARVRDAAAPTLILDSAQPDQALKVLFERGVRSVLLEGGPTLAGAFVAAGLVDRVVGYLAPLLLGAGPVALGPAGMRAIDQALRLHVEDVMLVGADVRITAVPGRDA